MSVIGKLGYRLAIDWHPDLLSIPTDQKDGRDVLVWTITGNSVICSWDDGWRDPVGRIVQGGTHWAAIEGPGL